MDIEQIKEYLRGDIKKSIVNDVFPCLNLDREESGHFAVPRLVLCYADFLGYLYTNVSLSKSAVKFIRDCFGEINSDYKKYGGLLYFAYRHGTVHEYEPKTIEMSNGQIIKWIIGKERTFFWEVDGNYYTHLKPKNSRFPISIKCLYDDLLKSIEVFIHKIESNSDLVTNFNLALTEIRTPKKQAEVKKKAYILSSDFSGF